jgi:hypothetical protein
LEIHVILDKQQSERYAVVEKYGYFKKPTKFKSNLIFGLGEKSPSDVGGLYQPIEFVVEIKVTDGGCGRKIENSYIPDHASIIALLRAWKTHTQLCIVPLVIL